MVRLVTSPAYQQLWGDRFQMTKTGERRLENNQTGFKLATSVGGVSTGERGDRILLDERATCTCWSCRRRKRRHSTPANTSSVVAPVVTGKAATVSRSNRARNAGSGSQAFSHHATMLSRAPAKAEAEGRRSRLRCWFTRGEAGSKFQRSPHGQADQGRQ